MEYQSFLQLMSEVRIRATTVPDDTGFAQVGGEPGEGGCPLQRPALRRRGRRRMADVITIQWPLVADERWFQCQHQAGLRQPSMQSMRKLISRHQGLEARDTTPEEAGKNRH